MQSSVLDVIDDPSLRAYVVWLPILPEDSLEAAREARSLVGDERASQFWDAERALPPAFASLLGLPEGAPAWDVYLAYDAGARWGDAPPRPSFWHHQLGEHVRAPVLDGDAFAEGMRALLKSEG